MHFEKDDFSASGCPFCLYIPMSLPHDPRGLGLSMSVCVCVCSPLRRVSICASSASFASSGCSERPRPRSASSSLSHSSASAPCMLASRLASIFRARARAVASAVLQLSSIVARTLCSSSPPFFTGATRSASPSRAVISFRSFWWISWCCGNEVFARSGRKGEGPSPCSPQAAGWGAGKAEGRGGGGGYKRREREGEEGGQGVRGGRALCVSACLSVSVCVRTHARTHTRTHARTHARARTHTRTHTPGTGPRKNPSGQLW